MKTINVTKSGKTYVVKIERETVNNTIGIIIKVFCGNENVMKHFLDFSKHPTNEIEQNITKFSDCFNENMALEWVDGYLKGYDSAFTEAN